MTRDETKSIVQVILMAFQKSFRDIDQGKISAMVDAWHWVLADYDYKAMQVALKAYMQTDRSGFAPSPGQLIGMMSDISTAGDMSEMEAWSLVLKAIRNGSYGAAEEFDKLPPLVQKAVGSPQQIKEWATTEGEESVRQSNFLRSYRQLKDRESKEQRLSTDIRQVIENRRTDAIAENSTARLSAKS